MTQQIINIGSGELAGDGETLRSAFSKINENFNDLYSNEFNVIVSDITPNNSSTGELWFSSLDGRLYVYYDTTWVDANPSSNVTNKLTSPDTSKIVVLDNSGNLTLPSGGIIKNHDGTQYGSSIDTGSFHFDGNTLNSSGISMQLVPDDEGATYIVIPSNAYGELQPLTIANGLGEVDIVSAGGQWTFGHDGVLALAGDLNFIYGGAIFEGGHGIAGRSWRTGLNIVGSQTTPTDPIRIYPAGEDGKGFSMGTVNVKNDCVEIYGNNQGDGNGVKWTFAHDGTLTLPSNGNLNFGQPSIRAPIVSYKNELITLYDFQNLGHEINYGIGVENHNIWMAVDASTAGFKWYAGETSILQLNGDGTISFLNNTLKTPVSSGAYIDGISSISLETPFTNPLIFAGQPATWVTNGLKIVISGVSIPSEVNGTWYIQSYNSYGFRIFHDAALTQPVDASSWSGYTGGGQIFYAPTSSNLNVDINSNVWTFGTDGTLNLPLLVTSNAIIQTPGTITLKAINANFNFGWDGSLTLPGLILAKQGLPGTNAGYSFGGTEGGSDTGMFSNQDGHLKFYTNNRLVSELTDNDTHLYVYSADYNTTYDWHFDRTGELTVPTGGTISYSPTTPSNWNGTAPTTIQEALDRIAALLKTLNGGVGA